MCTLSNYRISENDLRIGWKRNRVETANWNTQNCAKSYKMSDTVRDSDKNGNRKGISIDSGLSQQGNLLQD